MLASLINISRSRIRSQAKTPTILSVLEEVTNVTSFYIFTFYNINPEKILSFSGNFNSKPYNLKFRGDYNARRD